MVRNDLLKSNKMKSEIAELLDAVTEWFDDNTSYVVEEIVVEFENDYALVEYYPVDYALQNKFFDFERVLQGAYPDLNITTGYTSDAIRGEDIATIEVYG